VEEGKESQRIRAEFVDFLDRFDPVRGQISQPEVEDTPGRRVPRVGKKQKKKKKRGVRLGCWLLTTRRTGRCERGTAGRLGQIRPSSVWRLKNFFKKILFSFSYLSFRPPK
jgi:hypothetical protein